MASTSSTTSNSSCHLLPITEVDLNSLRYTWFSIHKRNIKTWSVHDCYAFNYTWLSIENRNRTTLTELDRKDRTHPIEVYPCLVYLIECQPRQRIRVWLRENEVHIEKCSDYMSNSRKSFHPDRRVIPCWVCKWLDWNEDWLIDIEPSDHSSIRIPHFYRLSGDRFYLYGDGGESYLVYPVWIHENLPVSEACRRRLLHVLNTLNEERQDHHPAPSPVEDIIDPDLLAYRPSAFDRAKWIEWRMQYLDKFEEGFPDFYDDLANGEYEKPSKHEQLRDTYQWFPSDFIIRTNGKVDIRSPIHHLPATSEYQQAYDDIARIFRAMLPMFKRLKLIKRKAKEEQRLQVIVKAQSYNLKAGMKYSGRWHTEGHKENIVAVGVYYLHVDEELEGGALKFRPKDAPEKDYKEIQTDYEISSIGTGAAVVFSNSMPHRFRQIRNLTPDDGRRRTFLNFFIVDPDQPIHLPLNEVCLAPIDVILGILHQWSDGRMPLPVYDKFAQLLKMSSAWQTQDEAKEFRACVRRAMLEEKCGWGYVHWGNSGMVEFVRTLCTWSPYKRREISDQLQHTESD